MTEAYRAAPLDMFVLPHVLQQRLCIYCWEVNCVLFGIARLWCPSMSYRQDKAAMPSLVQTRQLPHTVSPYCIHTSLPQLK